MAVSVATQGTGERDLRIINVVGPSDSQQHIRASQGGGLHVIADANQSVESPASRHSNTPERQIIHSPGSGKNAVSADKKGGSKAICSWQRDSSFRYASNMARKDAKWQ